tara:strand:+ start:4687 stop:5031 length:345 start_codon:yes stop_codon:yes gene_type:complete
MNKYKKKKFEERVNSYLGLCPEIIVLTLNYYHSTGEICDSHKKFDYDCLIESLKRSKMDTSVIFKKEGGQLILNGPFGLDYHPEYGFGIYNHWEMKITTSKFDSGNHWKIISIK